MGFADSLPQAFCLHQEPRALALANILTHTVSCFTRQQVLKHGGSKDLRFSILQTGISQVGNIFHMEQAGVYGVHSISSQWLTIAVKEWLWRKNTTPTLKAETIIYAAQQPGLLVKQPWIHQLSQLVPPRYDLEVTATVFCRLISKQAMPSALPCGRSILAFPGAVQGHGSQWQASPWQVKSSLLWDSCPA